MDTLTPLYADDHSLNSKAAPAHIFPRLRILLDQSVQHRLQMTSPVILSSVQTFVRFAKAGIEAMKDKSLMPRVPH